MDSAKIEQKEGLKKVVQLKDSWNLTCTLADSLLVIQCHNLYSNFKFQSRMNGVPKNLEAFCQNLGEVYQLITSPQAITLENQQLFVKCTIGKKQKKLSIDIQKINNTVEELLENKTKLFLKEQKKSERLEVTIVELRQKLAKTQQKYQKQAKQLKQLKQQIEEFNKDYYNCTNWNCRVAIAKKNSKLRGRSGPICSEQCQY